MLLKIFHLLSATLVREVVNAMMSTFKENVTLVMVKENARTLQQVTPLMWRTLKNLGTSSENQEDSQSARTLLL